MSKKNLLIVTERYPCGVGEDFLSVELPFLEQEFNIRIISTDTMTAVTRTLPDKVTFLRMPEPSAVQKGMSNINYLFSMDLWREIKAAQSHGAGGSYTEQVREYIYKARQLRDFIMDQDEFKSKKPLYIYNYTYTDYSFGCCMAARKAKKPVKVVSRIDREAFSGSLPPMAYSMDRSVDEIFFWSEKGKEEYLKVLKKSDDIKYKVFPIACQNNDGFNAGKTDEALHVCTCFDMKDLEAVSLLKDSFRMAGDTEIVYTHVGGGEAFDDAKILLEAAFDSTPNITINMETKWNRGDFYEYCRENHVDILLSITEDMCSPIELVTAISFGIIVATSGQENEDAIIKESYGLPLPPGITSEELARLMMMYAAIPADAVNIRRMKAYDVWDRYYNADRICTKMADALGKM